MSPEQIMSARVNGQADQFSLGVIAYEMLSGRRPFEADTGPGLMHQIMSVEPAPVHTLNPAVSARTSEVIGRALAKKPEDRFASCKEFVERLTESLNAVAGWETEAVTAAPMPGAERRRGRSRGGTWLATGLAVVALPVVAFVIQDYMSRIALLSDAVELVEFTMLAILVGVSWWVWQDATKRNMSQRWAIAVGFLLIIFLPLYLLVRKPVKCTACGKNIPASLSLCGECEQLNTDKQSDGRPGRIFG
jgi:hypothetical protein